MLSVEVFSWFEFNTDLPHFTVRAPGSFCLSALTLSCKVGRNVLNLCKLAVMYLPTTLRFKQLFGEGPHQVEH